jgi:cell division protein FtsW
LRTNRIDIWLLSAILILVIIGIVMMHSVSAYESYKIMEGKYGDLCFDPDSGINCNNHFYAKHLKHIFLGLVVFVFGMAIPISTVSFVKRISLGLFVLAFILLIALFIPGVAAEYGTARSWIDIPFLPSIQPSEIMKLGIIFYLASWMEKKENEVRSFEHGFLPFVILLTLAIFPIALQPDFGSLLVIGMIAVSMFFIAGGNLGQIFAGGALASLVAWPVVISHQYIYNRIFAFLDPESADVDYLHQIKQALMTIGSGGQWGVGVGNSGQRFGWLPEIESDTIFSAAAEELGFYRVVILLIGSFMIIAWRGFRIAERSNDRFTKLVATGITAWIVFQALINILVNLNMMPNTGITLPFVSYGGSSLIMLFFASGILLHISMLQNESQYFYKRRTLSTGNQTPRSRAPANRLRYRYN